MPNSFDGLPTHVLLVHAVVVLVPLSALLLVAAAVLPGVRARLGLALPALAGLCVALVPLTTRAGEWLQGRLGGGGPLVERHAELGDRVLPWTAGVLLVSLLVWWRGRSGPPVTTRGSGRGLPAGARGEAASGTLVHVAVVVLAAVVAVGAVVTTVRAGDSGARAVWEGVVEG